MLLGSTQKLIVSFLKESGTDWTYLGIMSKSELFRGFDWEEVDASLNRLIVRGIIEREDGVSSVGLIRLTNKVS